MSRQQIGRVTSALAAAGFVMTAGLHATGYDSVTRMAQDAPAGLGTLVPALWLVFSFDLLVIGLIIAVVAWRAMDGGRLILAIAAICPLAAAGLQIRFLGFSAPTAILLAVGGLTLIAAATYQSVR